ncbi:tRNA (guanine-N(7)-)-methyltransferase [Yersinia rohdei]|uniref:tRNA (guanine-N(7)-)-methyltransferase n=2 Tax=Yersinia rohdei TaxID=29485 RepID=A0A0U1HXD9_YERRO|nr:tRNA (guanine-N(7)-)-methyltransferase [Yersinia rohdei]CNI82571.1 tRNA (guanine-N(7)-)-methyltransferase [Yersinia rohdei]CQI96641.1 tRNA (guanine-N(7)-)-methyltransferase [Yersinia rohdei]CQJ50231.1 tRNA (guanine-N(7)-)-methyltransferase [Yersinia rohdei]
MTSIVDKLAYLCIMRVRIRNQQTESTMINDVISPEFDENGRAMRRIRSFVRRQGRLTKGQQLALDNYWPVMGVEYQAAPIDLASLFGREAPVVLEIGFGMGTSLVTMAASNPQQNFLGIEVHSPGVGACLGSAHDAGLSNLRVMCHDAVEVLENMIPDASLDMVQLFFPDPWHKARHNKRRIVQAPFVELVKSKLKVGGVFHMATDWQHYAEHMLEVMSGASGYRNLSEQHDYVPRPDSRPLTKFELRGQRLGHGVWDLMFERKE